MSLMWSIPLFSITFLGQALQRRGISGTSLYLSVALCSGLVFGSSEEYLVMIWKAKNIQHYIGRAAVVYIIAPEAALGLWTFQGYQKAGKGNIVAIIWAAISIMWSYLGSALFFWYLIEAKNWNVRF